MSTSGTLSPNACRLGRLSLSKRGNRSLSNRDVLLNSPRACAYGADNASIQRDRYAASEDDDLAGIGFLNAVKGTARLRQLSQIRGCFVEDARCHRFVDGKVDTSYKRAS